MMFNNIAIRRSLTYTIYVDVTDQTMAAERQDADAHLSKIFRNRNIFCGDYGR